MSSSVSSSPTLSVVVPVYGCVACLELLCSRLEASLETFTSRYEIILVDDRSPDQSWAAILALQETHPAVKGVRLSRNFGQQIAITAGLAAAQGDYVVVMDCDLQDPPERIPEMYNKLREGGHDLVLARRAQRNHSAMRLAAARLYFALISRLTEKNVDGSYGAFSLLSRKVVDAFLRFNERERHYLFILRWLGFNEGFIEYEHEERSIGRSSYTFRRLWRLAVDGIFFQATVLLRWIVTLGLAFAFFGVLLAGYFTYSYYAHGSVTGWTSVAVLILICTGAILVSLGVVGLYVGKIFDQMKGRPLHVVDTVLERRLGW
jgi:dolichol-phosphate mannosyltransferase